MCLYREFPSFLFYDYLSSVILYLYPQRSQAIGSKSHPANCNSVYRWQNRLHRIDPDPPLLWISVLDTNNLAIAVHLTHYAFLSFHIRALTLFDCPSGWYLKPGIFLDLYHGIIESGFQLYGLVNVSLKWPFLWKASFTSAWILKYILCFEFLLKMGVWESVFSLFDF